MPKPDVLPAVPWRDIHRNARDFSSWLTVGEKVENQQKMRASLESFVVEAPYEAFLRAVEKPVFVLALAKDWCPDVVRHVPVLATLEDACPSLSVRYFTRNDHPEILSRFLTNGGEAVPKFKFFNMDFVECGTWGPMPSSCREIIARGRACGGLKTARERVSALYAADPQLRIVVEELIQIIAVAGCTKP